MAFFFDEYTSCKVNNMTANISELVGQFKFSKLLKTDPQTKSIVLLGKINSDDAIISIEKSHFITDESNVKVNELVENLQIINHNDIYYWSLALLTQSLPDLPSGKLNIIYPATETHIKKYGQQNLHYVLETPETYEKFVKPYIESMKGDRIKWVYNILFEGKESETFIYHDKDLQEGFVLLPDMKWDKINMDSLYLCCIVNRTDISSVRDLNASHLSFLINIQNKIRKIASKTFPIKSDELRIFIHYQPSYYHFHIHIVNVKHPGLGDGIAVGKAILLDDVIENIRLKNDYYMQCNLGYLMGENHGLWGDEGFRETHYTQLKDNGLI